MKVRQTTVDAIFAAPGLLESYADECALPGLPRPNPSVDAYRAMQDAGVLRCIGVFDDEKLVGFATLIVSVSPHYGVVIAVTESLYVKPSARALGAGARLLAAVKREAKQANAEGLLVSAPVAGQLSRILSRSRNWQKTTHGFLMRAA